MFHHIILNSLFPAGARAISPEAFSFRCDSKTAFPGAEQRTSEHEARGACTPWCSTSCGDDPARINSSPVWGSALGRQWRVRLEEARHASEVWTAGSRSPKEERRLFIMEEYQDRVWVETWNGSDFNQCSECEQEGSPTLGKHKHLRVCSGNGGVVFLAWAPRLREKAGKRGWDRGLWKLE